MIKLLELFLVFLKVGIFGFGGGYGMISIIQTSVLSRDWLSETEFIRIIGVAEMTPGPIGINVATYVGYKVYGIAGSICATLGVALPSMLILMFISGFLFRNYKHPVMVKIFSYLRPAVIGVIIAALVKLAGKILLVQDVTYENFSIYSSVKVISVFTCMLIIFLEFRIKKKIHPIMYIVLAAFIGVGGMYIY